MEYLKPGNTKPQARGPGQFFFHPLTGRRYSAAEGVERGFSYLMQLTLNEEIILDFTYLTIVPHIWL